MRREADPKASAAALFVYAAVALTALEYWALPTRIQARISKVPWDFAPAPSLEAGALWAGACVLAYLVIPFLGLGLVFGLRPRSLGLDLRGFLRHLPAYLLLFLVMAPVVYAVSRREDFLRTYPFVPAARTALSTFLLWEAAYLAQFFALEAFFRGALLFGLERSIGRLAIPAMTVPYTMIHFHKPPLEAFGAAIAGLVLGHLALKSRSFLGGFVLHGLVAVTMDSLAAHRAGLFG